MKIGFAQMLIAVFGVRHQITIIGCLFAVVTISRHTHSNFFFQKHQLYHKSGIIQFMPLSTLLSNPLIYLLYFGALVICIDIHEFAHALIADRLGDPTAKLAGRLTLNPLAHLDPIGTIMLVLFSFGWGKPVPFDTYNLRNPKRDSALIALAGPVSNLLLAVVLAVLARVIPLNAVISLFFYALILLNVSLAVFNFLPLHPLDGGKILLGLVSDDMAKEWDGLLRRYGIFILLLLILPLYGGVSPLFALMNPIINFILKLLIGA